MKQLICEICGGNEIVKEKGVFVCRSCGGEYCLEEVKKLVKEAECPAETPETDNKEEAVKEDTEKEKSVKVKKKGKAKKIILSLVAVILVAAIGFGGYFFVENERKYNEYIDNAKNYVEKVEKAYVKMKNIGEFIDIHNAATFNYLWRLNETEKVLENAGLINDYNELKRLGNAVLGAAMNLKLEDNMFFHNDIKEIDKRIKLLRSDFGDCYSWLISPIQVYQQKGASALITTKYSDFDRDLNRNIKELKTLLN